MESGQGSGCCSSEEKDVQLQSYVGTKIILAKPMMENDWLTSKGEANKSELLGGNREGYLVIYDNSYRAWSPKEAFEGSYRLLRNSEKSIVNY